LTTGTGSEQPPRAYGPEATYLDGELLMTRLLLPGWPHRWRRGVFKALDGLQLQWCDRTAAGT
jgi:hypothetical protein